MEVASVFSKLLYTHTRSRFRRNHSSRVDEIRPGHCRKNLQWMGYSSMEIATVLTSSMRTTPSQASQQRLQLMEVANVFSKLLYTHTRSRFRRNHSSRVDEIRPGHCRKNLQ